MRLFIALWMAIALIPINDLMAQDAGKTPKSAASNLARDQLVAWCIVPFDGKKRGPAARAEMIKRIGMRRVAYDWRQVHVATFEEEILEYKKHGIEYFAFWDTHPEAFRLFAKHKISPQIWKMLSSPKAETQEEKVRLAAEQILPLVKQTRELGSKLGLYNHGGWHGEPENMVAVCQYLRKHHKADHVGIVYNQHHAHSRIDDFGKVVELLKPYLLCLNLNGMAPRGDQIGKKILPLGEGEADLKLLKIIRASGYTGPIGIIGHTQDDVEERLLDNLDGLDWLLPQLDGKPAGEKPKLRTWSQKKVSTSSPSRPGTLLEGRVGFRTPPLTIECRATLSDKRPYNILIASDTKASGAHWEIFSLVNKGTLTAYLPGMTPDHLHSNAMICDGKPHNIAMLYEPDRVRLLVDGKVVAESKMKSKGKPTVPGGLGIGRLVKEGLRCSGPVHWVRINRGIEELAKGGDVPIRTTATLLLWENAEKSKPKKQVSAMDYSPEIVAQYLKEAQESGNAERGVAVFASAKSACLSCHRIGKHGGAVGPELSSIAKQRKPNEIIESVVWPKRHVEQKFRSWKILTDEGGLYTGYIVSRDDNRIVLRDPTKPMAKPVSITVATVDAIQDVGTLMPDNLLAAMTEKQRRDLFRFLLSLGRDASLSTEKLDGMLAHFHTHMPRPVGFDYDRKPLRPEVWTHWEHHVNRDRVYDFYSKQARHFRSQESLPPMLTGYPGLDGGTLGHWGNQDDTTWASDRWNHVVLGTVQSGIFRGGGVTVPRGISVRLANGMAACFNPETLSYDAVWQGDFLKFSDFRHGFLNGVVPKGKLIEEKQPTPEFLKNKPQETKLFRGFYRDGDDVVFAYVADGTEFLDQPGAKDGKFTRTLTPRSALHVPFRAKPSAAIETKIIFGKAKPYAIDTIELPLGNPWNVPLFVGGLDFLPDGSAMVCTMHGDVWHVTGIQYPSEVAKWQRFASGLHHPLGLIVDDDGIFVLGRDQITRLHDLNDDGAADFYERFSSAYQTSPSGHDFICGLQRDQDGNFYTASGNQGIVRISADGKSARVVATGFRNPNGLGILPDGTLTTSCQEGSWTPASMICAAKPLAPGQAKPSFHGMGGPRNGWKLQLPLAYLPRGLDNSSGGQAVVDSDRWGPLTGQLLHFSFGTGAHFLVLRDEVGGVQQGAVVPLPGEFLSGAHRGRFNAKDGQLYVGGMQGWGSYTPKDGCLQRVRYTGDMVQLPVGFRVHENGVLLRFSEVVDHRLVVDTKKHFAQCWNYRYSSAYGSPEFSTKHFGMQGHDTLAIKSAHVTRDGKGLFLELPDLQLTNQLHLLVTSNTGREHELFLTVHRLADPFEDFPGYVAERKSIKQHPIAMDLAMATKSKPNPFRREIKGAREITIRTATNLSFETRSFRAKPGEAIKFTLENPDVVPHNWALLKPGTLRRVGDLANRLISDPDAAIRHYIPDSTDVLFHTDVVLPSSKMTIWFHAPKESGRYPYLCTFPGHWLIMNGEMIVEE